MTPTEQNIACAELDGWTSIHNNSYYYGVRCHKIVGQPPGRQGKAWGYDPIHDYVKDLNACAGLVAKLTKRQVALYHLSLLAMCNGRSTAIDASAPQRVEAILRATGKDS